MNTTYLISANQNISPYSTSGNAYFDDFFRECTLESGFGSYSPTAIHMNMNPDSVYHKAETQDLAAPKLQDIDFHDPVLDFDAFSDHFSQYTHPKLEENFGYFPSAKRMKVEQDDGVYSVPVSPGMSQEDSSLEEEVQRNRNANVAFHMLPNIRPPTTPTPAPTPAPQQSPVMPSFSLVIGKQPADGVVYKRILKPSPAVMLLEENTFMKTNRLFIDVVLVREDNGKEVDILEGNHPLPVCNGQYTLFKKLKIKETSRVHKTKFRLKFRLVQCNDQNYIPIPNICAFSHPISVFSHSSYVTKKKQSEAVRPPAVIEVLPSRCSRAGNTRVVIIGSNFINSPKLSVKIGNTTVTPTFHESGTLVITTPKIPSAGPCRISVSNDALNFTLTDTWLHFE